MEEWQYMVYLITHICLVFEYLLMTLGASVVLCSIAKVARVRRYKVIFLLLIIFGSVGRTVQWAILSLVFAGIVILSNTWGNFITIAPTFFFLMAYFSLLLEWFSMFIVIKGVTSNRGDPKKTRMMVIFVYFAFFIVLFGVFIILGTLSIEDGIQEPSTVCYVGNVYEQIMYYIISFSYIAASILFIICGVLLIREFRRNLMIVGEQHSRVWWRMIFIVFLVPMVFLFRAFLTSFDSTFDISEISWFDWAYYTFFEITPLSFVVLLCAKTTKWESAVDD